MAKARILIVEDEIIINKALCMALKSHGYEVCGAVISGEKAVEIATREKPDVILMDIFLKGDMDGIEAAREIHVRNKIPIIFITGYDEDDIIENTRSINPSMCFIKPIEIYEIKSAIERILN